jgi:phage terminase large subunit-like protein
MTSKEPFYQYVEGVLNGREIVGKFIRQAVERFVLDCDRKEFVFDYKEGKRIINFASKCNHWKGPKARTPIILDPHQHFYLIQKYGWKESGTGLPRFTRTFKEIGRKTGKTTEVAVESIYHVMYGIDEAAQVWTCATKEDDAIILVNDAGRIIEATPGLRSKFKLQISGLYVRRVSYDKRKAFIAFMTKGQDAVDTSMGIGDECHDWPNASVKQRIESSMGNRLAPSFTNITTAGFDKASYCYATLRDGAIKVLDRSIVDDRQLVIMHELDEEDDWKDKEKWIKANPNIPFSQTQMRYLENQFSDAIKEGGTTEVNFKTKNLNMWVDAPAVWIQTETFMKNMRGFPVENLKGRECFGAWHNITGKDLEAFCLFFPNIDTFDTTDKDGNATTLDIHAVKMLFFLPSDVFGNTEFSKWGDFINVDPGNTSGNAFIFDKIMAEINEYQLDSVVFRQGQENNAVVQMLINAGITCNPINQGPIASSQPTAAWGDALKSHQIEHFGNPVLKWCNSNTMAIQKGDNIKIERAGSKTCGIAACINAMDQWKTVSGAGTNDKEIASW